MTLKGGKKMNKAYRNYKNTLKHCIKMTEVISQDKDLQKKFYTLILSRRYTIKRRG